MIVSGPDIAQAQLIAKQLSSGAARLATLNGKQVLISTTPTVRNQQVQQATYKEQAVITRRQQQQACEPGRETCIHCGLSMLKPQTRPGKLRS